MKEKTRVGLSIVLWVAMALLLFVAAAVIFSREGEEAVKPSINGRTAPFDGVVAEAMTCGAVEGVAIALVEQGGTISCCGYGSLQDVGEFTTRDLCAVFHVQKLLNGVEVGAITLDEAVRNMYEVTMIVSDVTLLNIARFAQMLLSDGWVDDAKILSKAAVDRMLTSGFGWHSPRYISLLSDGAVEYCTEKSAIIVDREIGMALVVLVDGVGYFDSESFMTLRSKLASVASAMERETKVKES